MSKEIARDGWRSVCPVSSGLDCLGDKWSLLIVRDLLAHGRLTYSEFLTAPEHISSNILASRLRSLTAAGIIERTNPEAAARNNTYQLTKSGRDLQPVIEGLGTWSQTHLKALHPDMVELF